MRYPIYLNKNLSDDTNILFVKMLLRKAIMENDKDLLPLHILNRKKEAFSDGVSGDKGSWFSIIGDKVANYKVSSNFTDYEHNTPQTNEQYYYRKIYDSLYPNTSKTIPYFWMPKYVNATDASANAFY